MSKNNIPNIPADKFRFVGDGKRLHDQKFETQKISYFRDAFNRFCRNKSSVTAAIIILCLVLYAIVVPMFCTTTYSANLTDTNYLNYTNLLPKNQLCVDMGLRFWDGAKEISIGRGTYESYRAMAAESGYDIFVEDKGTSNAGGKISYNVRLDSYTSNGYTYLTVSPETYKAIQQWQVENDIQVIFPAVTDAQATDANIWYEADAKGVPVSNRAGEYVHTYRVTGGDGEYNSRRIEGDPGIDNPNAEGRYRYANVAGTAEAPSYKIRVFKYTYFQFKYGFEPGFLFGTTSTGHDILTRLANAARFSLLFAVCVASVNLFIGAIIGAIEGYYGGAVDMVVERIIDILARVPFMVVATLFQLHLKGQLDKAIGNGAGAAAAMFLAFIMTGWIGMAGTTRMQFYRYKGQEYVLASRVLGANDWRIMFRHIFPNSLGTIITSSVLVIPGVIFSESSLTYLGIVNLDSSTMTSVGTMLANARGSLQQYPHIMLFPALFISLLMISFNLFGNGLRDAFNPSLRGADE